MKSFIKRNLHIIIPTLCLILCICAVLPVAIYRVEGREISYDYSVTASPSGIYASGYEKDGDTLIPKDEGACLILPVTRDKEINDVRIIFKNKFKADCEVKLAYGTENSSLSHNEPIVKTVKKGYNEYYCQLSSDIYTVIECYIPAEIEIESVILSHVTSSTPVIKTAVNTPLIMWTLIPATVLYSSCITLLVYRKKRQ